MSEVMAPGFASIAALLVFAALVVLGRRLVALLGIVGEPPPAARYAPPPPEAHAPGDPAAAAERAAQRRERAAICALAARTAETAHTIAGLEDLVGSFDAAACTRSVWPDPDTARHAAREARRASESLAIEAAEHMHDPDPQAARGICERTDAESRALLEALHQAVGPLPAPDHRRLLVLLGLLLVALALVIAMLTAR